LGTWHGGLNHFDPKTGIAKRYHSGEQPGGLSNDDIWALCSDKQQNLWIGTIGGALNYLPADSENFSVYRKQFPNKTDFYVVWKVFQDSLGRIWIGTNQGLGRYDSKADHFVFYQNNAKDPTSISFNVVLDIEEDANHQLWIATRGGGLNVFDPNTEKFRNYREADGLPDDVVRSVRADNIGNLWLGTAHGLVQFNPKTKRFVTYDEQNSLQGNLFNFNSALKASSGEMIFGGANGFTIFDPSKLKSNDFVPPVAVVDFQIFNKSVVVGAKNSPLTKSISQTDSITLNYRQSVFSFSFVAMSYRNTDKNKFAYMMEGFENDWNYVGSDRRNATYTNLNPGTYVFKVRASNNEGVWNDIGRSIRLQVLPPPWKTWWAYTCYVLLVIGLLKWFVYTQRKLVVLLEAKVSERTAELQSKHNELEHAYVQLEAISLADPLTGLNNRRYLKKLIPLDVVKIQREFGENNSAPLLKSELSFTFLLLDIDFFKQVNDTHGQVGGDQLLIQISQLLRKICRESDFLVRWGGEEFLIVNRFAISEEAPLMAERIRARLAQHEFTLADGTRLQKTCSIGYASYPFLKKNPAAVSWEQVIDIADRALYIAKKSGRNCSVGFAESPTTPAEHLYEKLGSNLRTMIAKNELSVLSPSNRTLVWD
jgi:diguanylate cyclase (GGDEF)-like protein